MWQAVVGRTRKLAAYFARQLSAAGVPVDNHELDVHVSPSGWQTAENRDGTMKRLFAPDKEAILVLDNHHLFQVFTRFKSLRSFPRTPTGMPSLLRMGISRSLAHLV